jgi:hypothetical protein
VHGGLARRPSAADEVEVSAIRTNAAAAMLGVSPSTLRSWERRFGWPAPERSAGGHRQFALADVEALRAAFADTRDVAAAVTLARERGAGPAGPARLCAALARFDEDAADRVAEESIAVRSVERTVEEVLLPGVATLEHGSAERGFATRWATGWLAAALRAAPPASRDAAVVIFDAGEPGGLDGLHAHALELALRRHGVRTLCLPAALDPRRLAHAMHAVRPAAIVLAGSGTSLDVLGRLVFAARRACGGDVAVAEFRGALPQTGATTVPSLGERPLTACEALLALLGGASEPGRRPLRAVAG